MTKSDPGRRECAIARTVDVLKDPWAFLIVREALAGVTRFADFRANLGIATTCSPNGWRTGGRGVLRREQYQEPGSRPRPATSSPGPAPS